MNKLDKINVSLQDILQIYPNTSTIDLTEQTEDEKKKYMEYYSIYRTWFTEFIIRRLNLVKYDQMISSSNLKFKPVEEDNTDFYQYLCINKLKYFYIRNNIYVEKMTEDEKKIIEKYFEDTSLPYDETIEEFVKKTFPRLIFEDITRKGMTASLMYGPDSSSFMASNNSLVIGMRYDEWNMDGLTDDEWDRLDRERKSAFLPELFQKISQENAEKAFEVPIYIIKYNKFSIRNRQRIGKANREGEEKQ